MCVRRSTMIRISRLDRWAQKSEILSHRRRRKTFSNLEFNFSGFAVGSWVGSKGEKFVAAIVAVVVVSKRR